MNSAAYLEMAATESTHWWFSARRSILSKIIANLDLPRNARILEVGCGTGGNLQMLADFGQLSALEMDVNACEIAMKKTNMLYDIKVGRCPDEINFHGQHFDLICMFDVLEHIEQDSETLIAIKQLLTKDGHIIITVPAHKWLFGKHDEFLQHKRRYSAFELRHKIISADLYLEKISYFNTILFPLVILVRIKDKLLGNSTATGTAIPFGPINKILKFLFAAEGCWLKCFKLPFGVSLLCVLKNRTNKTVE